MPHLGPRYSARSAGNRPPMMQKQKYFQHQNITIIHHATPPIPLPNVPSVRSQDPDTGRSNGPPDQYRQIEKLTLVLRTTNMAREGSRRTMNHDGPDVRRTTGGLWQGDNDPGPHPRPVSSDHPAGTWRRQGTSRQTGMSRQVTAKRRCSCTIKGPTSHDATQARRSTRRLGLRFRRTC